MNVCTLGKLELETDLILAPMMDIGTPSFRQLVMDYGGVGMIYTPMLFINQMVIAPKTILPQLEMIEEQRPAAVQIVGSGKDEDRLKEAIEILNTYDFDVLDINSGCPSSRTMNSGGGGALIRDHVNSNVQDGSCGLEDKSRFHKFIERVLKYSDKPVSVKTRLGYNDENEIFEMIDMFNDVPIEFLTIHGRTISEKYKKGIHYSVLKKVNDELEVPLVGNGDVWDYESYRKMKESTGCDAVMVGRAAKSDPKIFQKIWKKERAARSDELLPDIEKLNSIKEVKGMLKKNKEFIENLSSFWNNERFLLTETKRLSIWLIKGIPGYKNVRRKLSLIQDFGDMWKYIMSEEFNEDFAF